jgi:hypothetical protein
MVPPDGSPGGREAFFDTFDKWYVFKAGERLNFFASVALP